MGVRPSRFRRFWLCGLYLALPGVAQTPSTPAQEPTPELRITTHLVQVNVVVQDKKEQPVGDLTRDDFVLLDEGQAQEIAVFSVEKSEVSAAPAEALPPNTFSNHLEHRAGLPTSVTVILFDSLNTDFADQAYARDQVVKFLEQLQPGDRVALYALANGLRVLHDFTSDAQPLLRAMERYRASQSHKYEASKSVQTGEPSEDFSNWLNESAGSWAPIQRAMQARREMDFRAAGYYMDRRAEETVQALEGIAQHLAQFPGRKNLVWVSGSFPFWIGLDTLPTPGSPAGERRTYSREIERAARALSYANLAIYPVDARGLTGLSEYSAARQAILRGRSPSTDASIDTMDFLAARTGGRAFRNTNDIRGAIRRAVDDSRVTYVLGFYPKHGKWDGKFRKIKVQVKRPGLRAHHRDGYFALPEDAPSPQQRQTTIALAVWSPLDASAVRLVVHTNLRSDNSIEVQVTVDPRDVTFTERNDRWAGAVDFILVELSAEGKNLKGFDSTFEMNLKPETHERILRQGLNLGQLLPFVRGATRIRVVVRDAATGAIGSVSLPLSSLVPERRG